MRRKLGLISAGLVLLVLMVYLVSEHRKRRPLSPRVRARKIVQTVAKGSEWLGKQQSGKGSSGEFIGLTALATIALQGSSSPAESGQIERGLEYIAKSAQPNGAISGKDLPNYNTALSVVALRQSGNPEYDEVIGKGINFLRELQCDQGEGYTSENWFYGGIGYGGDSRPDLSNTFLALDALKAADLPQHSETWDRALKFLERCQNYQTNDQPWAVEDGGFIYYPGSSKAGGTQSYGSMTYAGLLSYTYCGLDKDDPRVRVAVDWIRQHYTLDENPAMGKQGLYFYYFVMAKSLAAYGERQIVDSEGHSHAWADELADKLIRLQHRQGYWVNEEKRWMENNKALVTAYALIALKHCRPFLTLGK